MDNGMGDILIGITGRRAVCTFSCNGNDLSPVRYFNFRGMDIEAWDSLDELRADKKVCKYYIPKGTKVLLKR